MTNSTVPTTGMKLSGIYMKYRMIAVGVNFSKGFLNALPSLEMGSPPEWSCLPSATMPVILRETSVCRQCQLSSLCNKFWSAPMLTPSNVSISASPIKNVLLSKFVIVELSLSTRRIVDSAASGPFMIARTAAWGMYLYSGCAN